MVREARSTVSALLWGGALAFAIGVAVAGFAWPYTEVTALGTEDHGSRMLTVAGLALAAAGQLALLAGIIAHGVRLGIVLARPDTSPTPSQPRSPRSLSDVDPLD